MAVHFGLRFLLCVTAIALELQGSNAGVMRDKELSTQTQEATTEPYSTSYPTVAEETVTPDDIGSQTTLPPIFFRAQPFLPSEDDTASADVSAVLRRSVKEVAPGQEIRPELSRSVLLGAEPSLGGESPLAGAPSVGGNSSVVSTAQLAHVSASLPGRPGVGILAGRDVGMKSSSSKDADEKNMQHATEIPHRDDGRTERLPSQADAVTKEHASTESYQSVEVEKHVPKTLFEKQDSASMQVFPKEPKFSDSFIPPAVQVLAYTIDRLWEKEKRTGNSNEEENPLLESEPAASEDSSEESSRAKSFRKQKKEIGKAMEEDEDDASNRPVFQTNVPVVNEESVPMRMTMDIIPVDFSEDYDDSPIQYPTDMGDYDDEHSNNSQLEDDTLATGSLNQIPTIQYPAQFFAHPWGKDHGDEAGLTDLIGGHPEDIERDIEERIDLFLRLQQRFRAFEYSTTFDNLVKLHKDLAIYARNHNLRKYKGYSDIVIKALQQTSGSVAEQLRVILGRILEDTKIEDASLEEGLRDLHQNLNNSNSEAFITLRHIPPLRFS